MYSKKFYIYTERAPDVYSHISDRSWTLPAQTSYQNSPLTPGHPFESIHDPADYLGSIDGPPD